MSKFSNHFRPPNGQIGNGQPITFSDVIPVAAQNNNPRPIVFKTSFANPHPTRFGTANAIPAAPSAAPVLGLQLAKRHWSIEPTEAWVVQPSEPPTPATWPQKVLHSGVYIMETAGALSGVALCAIVVGGWRTAKSLYQNRRPLQQECTMAVVTGYRAAKRRLVTLRMPAMPIQSTWRRQFDPAARRNGSSQHRRFLWQRIPGQDDAMEGVESADESFFTPPSTRYSTPEDYSSQKILSQPEDKPRTFWASDRGFRVGERRGPRRPSEDSDASDLDEYLADDNVLPTIERVKELHAPTIRPSMLVPQHSSSPAIKEEPESPERQPLTWLEGDSILPSIEADEMESGLPPASPSPASPSPSPASPSQSPASPSPASPSLNPPANGSPRLSTTSTDIRILEEAPEPRPTTIAPAPATREATETAKIIPRRDPTNGLSESEVSTYMGWIAKLGQRTANQKDGDSQKFHAFDPAFYANLKNKGAKSVINWASEAHIGGSTLLDVDKLLIPILTGRQHWALLVVSPKAKTIDYYDSLGSSARPHIRLARAWLAEELGKNYRERDWSTPSGSRGAGPRQAHCADCGIIACMTARLVVLGRDPMALDCSTEGIEGLWARMEAELLDGGLPGDK